LNSPLPLRRTASNASSTRSSLHYFDAQEDEQQLDDADVVVDKLDLPYQAWEDVNGTSARPVTTMATTTNHSLPTPAAAGMVHPRPRALLPSWRAPDPQELDLTLQVRHEESNYLDFLQDPVHTMTYSRRLALFLASHYDWYNPQRRNEVPDISHSQLEPGSSSEEEDENQEDKIVTTGGESDLLHRATSSTSESAAGINEMNAPSSPSLTSRVLSLWPLGRSSESKDAEIELPPTTTDRSVRFVDEPESSNGTMHEEEIKPQPTSQLRQRRKIKDVVLNKLDIFKSTPAETSNSNASVVRRTMLLDSYPYAAARRERPEIAKAWAYYEHVALARYVVPEEYRDGTLRREKLRTRSLPYRIFRQLCCKGRKKYTRAEPGEPHIPTVLYPPWLTPHAQLGDWGLGIGLYFSTLRAITSKWCRQL
jgi:hypothetical protein